MNHYCLGFMFGPYLGFGLPSQERYNKVALIRKNKPEFQVGKLNGIGGKVEPEDATPFDAMVRKFKEETGVVMKIEEWYRFATMLFPEEIIVDCFCAVREEFPKITTMTDEKVVDAYTHLLLSDPEGYNPMKNLLWLIPMAIGHLRWRTPHLTIIGAV